MKNLHIIILACIVATLAACTEDLPIDAAPTTGILCLNGYLYSDCDTNLLYVTTTGVSSPKNVKDATVRMFVNGTLAEEKTQSDSTTGGYYHLKTKFHPGDVVRIEADYNGLHAYREATVPDVPKDLHFSVTPIKSKSFYDQEYEEYVHYDMYRIDISFTDISSGSNYYRLYTNYDKYKIDNQDHRERIIDTVYYDGIPYEEWRDSVYYSRDTIHYYTNDSYYDDMNEDLYIGEAAPLTDEEMSADNDFMDGLYNYYNVFNNSRFAGGKCELKIYQQAGFGSRYSSSGDGFPPEEVTVYSDDPTPPEYYYTQYVGIESIDEQGYYYIKSLNGYESGAYSNDELTGSVKMWRNVEGGSGNIIFASRAMEKVVVLDGYTPKVKIVERRDEARY